MWLLESGVAAAGRARTERREEGDEENASSAKLKFARRLKPPLRFLFETAANRFGHRGSDCRDGVRIQVRRGFCVRMAFMTPTAESPENGRVPVSIS